ncbi:MAG TPA: bifunctional folylpolyglutamate synthase/dihydrofolate synthase, partial [Opitutae bacterium]|nr:bifunctional folylpolyglutamate synthase/dihydrofolate synthase [Opitutae bacterium]HCY57274.1 bifunctional folylpolyglutamate synthase/dihydrofolate synthase [Opitutae bacterium]
MKMFLDYLYKLRNEGSSFGLERMRILLDRLNNPQGSYPVIHVAGTNGKGSVCAMLNSIYQSNGYKVGLFSSPHLIELGERVQVNGENM